MPKELEPNEAVRHAKRWLASIYSDEKTENVGLEEVRWRGGNWEITLGFDRYSEEVPDDTESRASSIMAALSRPRRDYKVIVVSGEDNSVIEMRNREAA